MAMFPYRDTPPGGYGKRSDAQPLTGFRQLGHVLVTRPWQLIQVSVLFSLACLPVVTIPMAWSALCRICGSLLERRMSSPIHDFPKAMLADWKRVLGCGWVLLGIQAVSVVGIAFYAHAGGLMGNVIMTGVVLVLALLCMATAYVFPLIWMTDFGYRDLMRDSLLLAMVRLPRNLLVLLGGLLFLGVVVLLMPYSLFVLPLFGWAVLALFATWNATDGIRRYVVTERQSV